MQERAGLRQAAQPGDPCRSSCPRRSAWSLLPRCLAEIQYVDYRRQDRQTAFALIRAINRLPAPAQLPDPLPEVPAAPGSHLGELFERIDSTGELNLEEQIAIVFKLKEEIPSGPITQTSRAACCGACGSGTTCGRRWPRRSRPRWLGRTTGPPRASALRTERPLRATRRHDPPQCARTYRSPVDASPSRNRRSAECDRQEPRAGRVPVGHHPRAGPVLQRRRQEGLDRLGIAVVGGSATYGLAWLGAAIWSAIDAYNVASGKSPLG